MQSPLRQLTSIMAYYFRHQIYMALTACSAGAGVAPSTDTPLCFAGSWLRFRVGPELLPYSGFHNRLSCAPQHVQGSSLPVQARLALPNYPAQGRDFVPLSLPRWERTKQYQDPRDDLQEPLFNQKQQYKTFCNPGGWRPRSRRTDATHPHIPTLTARALLSEELR